MVWDHLVGDYGLHILHVDRATREGLQERIHVASVAKIRQTDARSVNELGGTFAPLIRRT